MELRLKGMAVLRELARRRPVAVEHDGPDALEAAAALRRYLYPKQRWLFARDAGRRKRATKKTRRAGATAGGVRELLARALEQPGFRATYATDTLKNARKRAWRNDTKSGFTQVLAAEGEHVPHRSLDAYRLGGITVVVRDGDLQLDLSNGSHIELIGADALSDHTDMRGIAKHVIWVDEAQDFPYLEEFYTAVVVGSLTDFRGEAWFTGTPGKDCAGLFYEITKEEEDERTPGWDVHVIEATDNPFFGHVIDDRSAGEVTYYVEDNTIPPVRSGPFESAEVAERAAVQVRWDNTAELAKTENHWRGDEPDYLREQLGKWVKGDARYVYPVHAVSKAQLLFAPQRLTTNPLVGSHPRFDGHPPWYDHHLAVRDLPRKGRDGRYHKWLYSLWFDFGFHPDPFACVMWAFSTTHDHVFEMFSWKQTGIHADDQATYIKLIYDAVPEVVSFGGDAAGKQADFAEWERRLNLPLEEANKAGKNTLEELLAGDIRRGLVQLREDSPLYTEMRHLVYLPTQPGKPRQVHKHRAVAGVVHGDHCCFVAGTLVATERGPMPIESVTVGAMVHIRSGELRPVVDAFSVGKRSTWRLECSDGTELVGTHDHPIWTSRGWVPLAMLALGDEVEAAIYGPDEPTLRVRRVGATGRNERVYNLTVAGTPEFFANGILVHNCDAGRYGFSALTHYLAKIGEERPPPGSRAALQAEGEREERDLDRREAQREARDVQIEEADDLAREYNQAGDYEW